MDEQNQNTGQGGTPAEKTYTQSELDSIVKTRVGEATKDMPTAEELTAYRTWKDSQQTETERQAKRDKELTASKAALTAAQAELEQLKRDKYVLSKGLTGEDAEFVAFKAAKMVDDKTTFEQAVDQIVKTRHKAKFDWTAPVGGGQKETNINAAMNSLIRDAVKK